MTSNKQRTRMDFAQIERSMPGRLFRAQQQGHAALVAEVARIMREIEATIAHQQAIIAQRDRELAIITPAYEAAYGYVYSRTPYHQLKDALDAATLAASALYATTEALTV